MRTVVLLVVLAVVVLAVILGYLAAMETRMIFYPERLLAGTPADVGWSFEDVPLRTEDGVRVHAWFLPAPSEEAERPTVLFLHGNAGNISHRLEKLRVLRALGADVLILEYRGYGQSDGRPSEAGLHRDARAAYEHLLRERRVPPSRLLLYGESLGTGVAVRLAADRPVGGVVLEAPFTSVPDVAASLFPWLPVRWIVRNRFENLRWLPQVRAPVLLLHSRDDETFPLSHAERLAVVAPDARLVVLRGGHNDAFQVSDSLYRQALSEFLARARAS